MARSAEREPEGLPCSSVPVQRITSTEQRSNDQVPPAWLAGSEHLPEAERLGRLEADFDLVTTLALGGFTGPDWEYFATEVARYGLAVIGGWMRGGLIYERCRARGYGVPLLERPFTDDEIVELSGETVAKALVHFRADVLMKGRWDYRRGASLKTYFIGQCLIRFANVYRRWFGNEARQSRSDLTDPTLDNLDHWGSAADAPDRQAVAGIMSTVAMAGIKNPKVRKAMFMTAEGRTQAEIGVELGVTEKAVERMLANERKRIRRRIR